MTEKEPVSKDEALTIQFAEIARLKGQLEVYDRIAEGELEAEPQFFKGNDEAEFAAQLILQNARCEKFFNSVWIVDKAVKISSSLFEHYGKE